MRFSIFFILLGLLSALNESSGRSFRLRNTLNNFTAHTYDDIHRLVVLDQIDNYLKPIKSPETRRHKSLNGLYDFCFDQNAKGFDERWFESLLSDSCPHDFSFMPVPSAFNDILSNKTAKNYVGWMWYQRMVDWEIKDANQNLKTILQFENVNYLSVVWIQLYQLDSDKSFLVGSHVGGHLPVTLDLSSILRGADGPIVTLKLTIAVSNLLTSNTIPSGRMVNMTKQVGRPFFKFQPDFDFFNFAGIMGDVRIFELAEYYIEDIEILPDQAANHSMRVRLCLNAVPQSKSRYASYHVHETGYQFIQPFRSAVEDGYDCSQIDHDECELMKRCALLTIYTNETSERRKRTTAPYNLRPAIKVRFEYKSEKRTPLNSQHAHIDVFEMRVARRRPVDIFGAFSKADGTRQIQGFGMHHEQLFSGRTMSLAAIMKDLYLVKEMAANVIRTSHYPYSRAYLDAADAMGLHVIAECPAVGLSSFSDVKLLLHKQILLEMMQRDHDHPSIVAWSLANEPQSQLAAARPYFKSLIEYAKTKLRRFTIDAKVPLTAAIAQSHRDDTIGDLLDVLMINRYYGWYDCTGVLECIRPSLVESLTGWTTKYGRGKPLVVSEFGADTLAGFHSDTSDMFSEEFQRDLIVEYERVFDELALNRFKPGWPNFSGAMIWNFADFSTDESLMRAGGNRKGLFTRTREPKLAASVVKQIYNARGPALI